MTTTTDFKKLERELLPMPFDSMAEYKVLKFWHEHEPKKVAALMSQSKLRRTAKLMVEDLLDMQIALEKTEHLDPAMAETEAWNRLMRIEEDEAEEAEAWGMTVEEYRNRPCG